METAAAYRTLRLFEQLGMARVSRLGDDAGRWEVARPDEHFHLACEICRDAAAS